MKGVTSGRIDRRTLLRLTGGAGATAGLGALAGCLSDPDGDDDDNGDELDLDTLTITQGEFPDVEDPNDHITGPYFNVYDHVYEPLFDVTPGEEPEGRIVEDWEHDEDERTVELSIRDDVVFHQGQELTADDIAFTLERQIDGDVPPASDQVAGLGSIEGAEAIDDTTLELSYAGAPQLAEFEFGNYLRAVSQGWFENDAPTVDGVISGDDEEAFNGTGPLQVVEYNPGQNQIVMEPFDDYWGEVPNVNEVIFEGESDDGGRVNSLLADETNFIDNIQPNQVGNVDEEDDYRVERVVSFRNIFLAMKSEIEPFDSQEFRQAMNYAVDNENIIDEILNGLGSPMSQPTPPEVNGHNPDLEPYDHDLDEAESLVEDAGYTEDDPAEITLTAPEGRYLNDTQVGERAASQIDELPNVECDFEAVPFDVVSDANSTGPDTDDIPFFLIGWGVITGDADYGMFGFFHDDGGVQNIRDDELQTALEESQVEEDPETREEMLQDLNELAREKAPWVFLHQQENVYGIDADIEWEPREDESVFVWEMS